MKVALCTRVSTRDKGQETANQLLQLREFGSTQWLADRRRIRRPRVRREIQPVYNSER